MAVGTNNAAAACMIYTLVVASFWLGVASRTATEVDLCRYQRQFKMLLWTTSAILALAIVQVSLLHLWGAGQFEKTFASDATATAKAITISFGLLASGTGCAIFLPVAIVQRRRLDELLEQEMNKEKGKRKRKDILEEWGFEDVGAGQFLVNHIAVLAPLATALLARALE